MDGKWVSTYTKNGMYCGQYRLTHLLLTSWDILVELAIPVGVSIYTYIPRKSNDQTACPLVGLGILNLWIFLNDRSLFGLGLPGYTMFD